MRKLFFSLIYLTGVLAASAQQYTFLNERSSRMDFFNHLDASVTLGTTGIGFDLATPVGDYVQLRAGYAFMPRFHHSMHFDVQVGDTKESKYDADGNRVQTKFDKMAALLEDFSGYKAQDEVEVIGRPTYNNLKVMVDVFPFQSDRRWHITAGFFWGPSKIADAYNVTEAMPSLFAVSMYNRLYDKTMVSYESVQQFYENGSDIIPIFSVGDFYELTGPTAITAMYNKMHANGRMGIHLGDKVAEDGTLTPYMMEPGDDGMVKAEVRVNSFKPYLGVGYGGRLLKNNDRLHIAADLGVMFWGGTPDVVTHDGTNLSKDVSMIGGKVGDYVRFVKSFKVFPVLDVRFVYNIF
jgi:hypothetical protein